MKRKNFRAGSNPGLKIVLTTQKERKKLDYGNIHRRLLFL